MTQNQEYIENNFHGKRVMYWGIRSLRSFSLVGFQFLLAMGLRRESLGGCSAIISNISLFTYNFHSFSQVGLSVLSRPVVEVEKISALSSFLLTAKHQRSNRPLFIK